MTIDAQSLADVAKVKGSEMDPIHRQTPLVHSESLSAITGHNVFLKLEAFQPSGSFKIRGIGRVSQEAYSRYGKSTHIVSSSGGNAGLAAATCASHLNVKCTVVVPLTTESSVVSKLESLGATVEVHGEAWDESDRRAREIIASDACAVYVHPFEGENLVEGHTSMIDKIYASEMISPIDLVLCSVGGGGLVRGILRGFSRYADQYPPPHVVAVQDFGADSFSQSFKRHLQSPQQEISVVTLEKITSKATSMGAKTCSKNAVQDAKRYRQLKVNKDTNEKRLSSLILDDSFSASACWQFFRDHEILVELSCGAALAALYQPERILQPVIQNAFPESKTKKLNILVIVCGESKIGHDLVQQYQQDYGLVENGGRAQLDGIDLAL